MTEKQMDLGRGRRQRRARPGCGWRGGHGGEGIWITQRNWPKSSVWMGMRLRKQRVLLERLEEGERLKLALRMGLAARIEKWWSPARSMNCSAGCTRVDGD